MNEKNLTFQIALTLVDGVGDIWARNLTAHYGSAEEVFKQKAKELSMLGIPVAVSRKILSFKDFSRAEQEVEFITRNHIQVWNYHEDGYPKRLKQIPDAPFLFILPG